MSVKVMTAVFERYPNGGGEMLLALALADHAADDGTSVYPSVRALAEKTRQSTRTVQYQMRRMEDMGWLILVNAGNGGRSMTSEYRISLEWIKGAEIAPFSEADFESDEKPETAQKGAEIATFRPGKRVQLATQKGATDDTKGCNPRQKRVQPVAPANNHQESSLNHHRTGESARAARKCPPGFLVSDAMRDWAAKNAPSINVQQSTDKFLDHEFAKAKTDWPAAWRNWLRTDQASAAARAGQGSETAYQRSMRLRVAEAAPSIARRAPGASGHDAAQFFGAIEVATRIIPHSGGSS